MKICIIGAGSFAIAMCKSLENDNDVCMYTKFENEREMLKDYRENIKLFKGIKIGDNVVIADDLKEAINDTEFIICAIPFMGVENLANELKDIYLKDQIIVSVTKGIDGSNFKSSSHIFKKVLNTDKVCLLSGPSFAIDVIDKENISLMLAGSNSVVNEKVKELFESKYINIEITNDEIGVAACASIKNAIAIGSGILEGMGKSSSSKAAYLTNGLKDMEVFIKSLGGKKETVYTYAGIGDLILTCFSLNSRNCSFGYHIGKGKSKEDAIDLLGGKAIEGIIQIEVIYNYMIKNNLDFKIIPILYNILEYNKDKDLLK